MVVFGKQHICAICIVYVTDGNFSSLLIIFGISQLFHILIALQNSCIIVIESNLHYYCLHGHGILLISCLCLLSVKIKIRVWSFKEASWAMLRCVVCERHQNREELMVFLTVLKCVWIHVSSTSLGKISASVVSIFSIFVQQILKRQTTVEETLFSFFL